MKKNIVRILAVFITILLIFILINSLSNIMRHKEAEKYFNSFFEVSNNIDILFLGNSHVQNGYLPTELWKYKGFTSYNIASAGSTMPMRYWVMMNALDYAKPKLIVLDCSALDEPYKINPNSRTAHLIFDLFPLTKTKIKSTLDLFDNSLFKKQGELIGFELLWDYYIYHYRWDELSKTDFEIDYSSGYGVRPLYEINREKPFEFTITNDKYKEEKLAIIYLKKIIEECKKQNIEILLTYIPGEKENYSTQVDANTVEDIAKEYNVNFINFYKNNHINYTTDFTVDRDHLNIYGARRITKFLGDYIDEHYEIPDKTNPKRYKKWDEEVNKFNSFSNEELAKSNHFEDHLIGNLNAGYNILVEINDLSILSNDYYKSLFENLEININQLSRTNNLIIIEDSIHNLKIQENPCSLKSELDTRLGTLKCIPHSNRTFIDGYESLNQDDNSDIKLFVLNPTNNKMIYYNEYYKTFEETLSRDEYITK